VLDSVLSAANALIDPMTGEKRVASVAAIAEWLGTSSAMVERHYNRFVVEQRAHLLNGAPEESLDYIDEEWCRDKRKGRRLLPQSAAYRIRASAPQSDLTVYTVSPSIQGEGSDAKAGCLQPTNPRQARLANAERHCTPRERNAPMPPPDEGCTASVRRGRCAGRDRPITDRLKLHAALQQLIRGAYFGEHHEVVILSKAGLLLMVTARRGGAAPYLMMLRRDGQAAIVDSDGNLRITDASTDLLAAGMTPLDAMTVDDVLEHLRQNRP
jgi:hypothetical protein